MMKQSKDPIDRIIESTHEFGRVMRHQMLGSGTGKPVNFLQLHALYIVGDQEGLTMKELANALHVASPSATSMVNRLVAMQWVSRLTDARNRKLVRLKLTPLGKRVLCEKQDKRREALRGIFGLLTKREQVQLASLHEKLRKKLSEISFS